MNTEEMTKRVKEEVNKCFNCNKCCFKQDCEFMNGKNTSFDCMECPADEWAEGYRQGVTDTYERLYKMPVDALTNELKK